MLGGFLAIFKLSIWRILAIFNGCHLKRAPRGTYEMSSGNNVGDQPVQECEKLTAGADEKIDDLHTSFLYGRVETAIDPQSGSRL